MQLTKKDAEERMRPLYAKIIDTVENVAMAKEAYNASPNSDTAAMLIALQFALANRQSEYIAEANEIIRQGVA